MLAVDYSNISEEDDAEQIAAKAAAFAAATGADDSTDDEDDVPPDGGEYRRTPGGYRFHIPAYICNATGDLNGDTSIVGRPLDGGSRTITVKQSATVSISHPAAIDRSHSPARPRAGSSGQPTQQAAPTATKARKPGRQERLRRRRQAARAADAMRAEGNAPVLLSSKTVPSQVKSAELVPGDVLPDRRDASDDSDAVAVDAAYTARGRQPESVIADAPSESHDAVTRGPQMSAAAMDTVESAPESSVGEAQPNKAATRLIPVVVILVHRGDLQPCPHDLYCPQGRLPFCTCCQQPDSNHP